MNREELQCINNLNEIRGSPTIQGIYYGSQKKGCHEAKRKVIKGKTFSQKKQDLCFLRKPQFFQ